MNFPFSDKVILGGMLPVFFHWSKREWPISFLQIIDGVPICDMMAYPEAMFVGYSLPEQARFSEKSVEEEQGKRYEYQYSGLVKDYSELEAVLAYMLAQRHFVVCADKTNRARLLGRPGNMCQFSWSYDSGVAGSDDALIRWQFTWISKEPAPYVPFYLCGFVEGNTDPVSPLEGYVEAGYWLSEYTE